HPEPTHVVPVLWRPAVHHVFFHQQPGIYDPDSQFNVCLGPARKLQRLGMEWRRRWRIFRRWFWRRWRRSVLKIANIAEIAKDCPNCTRIQPLPQITLFYTEN